MVDSVRAGRDPDDLAHELKLTAQSIRNWVAGASAGSWMGERLETGSATTDADE